MKRSKELITVLLLTLAELAYSEVYYNVVNREDPCINLCEKTPLSGTDISYVKSCCQRGCRFFNLVDLVDLRYGLEPESLNGTRSACENSCTDAYTESQDRYACSTGCDFMAKQRISDLLSLLSVAIYVEEGVDSNILLMPPDIPENDILSDPGLRKELFPGWWDSNGFKLPQTYIKTVPMDSGTVDYGIPPDYSGESEQSASVQGSDWLQCASRHTGIPNWLLASAIVIGALAAFWPCLSPEKVNDPYKELLTNNEKPDTAAQLVLMYVPEKAPVLEKPPPEYSGIVITEDINMKV